MRLLGIVPKATSFMKKTRKFDSISVKNFSNTSNLRFQKLSPSCIFLFGSANYHYSELNFNNIPSVEETPNKT